MNLIAFIYFSTIKQLYCLLIILPLQLALCKIHCVHGVVASRLMLLLRDEYFIRVRIRGTIRDLG